MIETSIMEELLTYKEVQALTKIKSRTTIWAKSRDKNDNFPRPYKIGARLTGWKRSELQEWLDQLEPVK